MQKSNDTGFETKIALSPIHSLIRYKNEAIEKGVQVYSTHIGDSDLPPPPSVEKTLQSLSKSVKKLGYTPARGNTRLIQQWIRYYRRQSILLDEADILVTQGASEAFSFVNNALLSDNDRFLIFSPYYGLYKSLWPNFLSRAVTIPLLHGTRYSLPSKDEIISYIDQRVKAILITNPNNPTGTVYTSEELQTITKLAEEKNLYIISDETYQGLAFDKRPLNSILSTTSPTTREKVIVVNSLSKQFSVAGLRMGVLVTKNASIMDKSSTLAEARVSASYIDQEVAADILSDSYKYRRTVAENYNKRCESFINTFRTHHIIPITRPEGGMYIFLKLPIKNSEEFARWLLTKFNHNRKTVMVTPGNGFYSEPHIGLDEVRIALVYPPHIMSEVAEILAVGLREYTTHVGSE